MEMNVKELEKIVREVTSNDEHILIRNMLYGSEIDSKKLANAVKRYAYHAMDETVVGLSDHTLFGSAKEGFVITDKCLYSSFFKFSPSRKQVVTSHGHCIFFDGIKSVSPQKDSYLTINYADGNSITISCNNYREWIMNLLNGIIQPGAADEEESIAEPSIKEATAQKEKEEAERKAKEEAARKAKEEAARKAKEEAARKAKEEAARKAKEEAARKAKEEAQRKAKEEADRKLFEDIKRLNNIDAWEKADFMVFDDEADGVFKSAEALVKRNITEAK
ncbi:MAG: hypothetical protein KBS83_06655, partial [Lachnospiraceae bacterium]|nr:hypothetical protein [Candidatus Equihabitans merdae]